MHLRHCSLCVAAWLLIEILFGRSLSAQNNSAEVANAQRQIIVAKREINLKKISVLNLIWPRQGDLIVARAYDRVMFVNFVTGKVEATLPVTALGLTLSPDEKTLAVSTGNPSEEKGDNAIQFWTFPNAGNKAKSQTPTQVKFPHVSMFSADGKVLFASEYGATRLQKWNPADGTSVGTLPVENIKVDGMAASSDGRLFAFTGDPPKQNLNKNLNEKRIVIWDVNKGAARHQIDEAGGMSVSAEFSPNGKLLAIGSTYPAKLEIWDTETGAVFKKLEGHGKEVRALAFLNDRQLVSGSNDETIRIWDLETGESKSLITGLGGNVYTIAVSPDSKWFTANFGHGRIRFWNVDELVKAAQDLAKTGPGTSDWLLAPDSDLVSIDVSRDERYLVGQSRDQVRLTELASRKVLKSFPISRFDYLPIAITPDGTQFAYFGERLTTIEICQVPGGESIRTLKIEIASEQRQLKYTPDGKRLILAQDKSISVWDASTYDLEKKWDAETQPLESMALTSDSTRLLTGGQSGSLKIWDMKTFELQHQFKVGKQKIISIAIDSKGTLIATSCDNEPVKLWSMDGKKQSEIRVTAGRIHDMLFLPDSKIIAIPAYWPPLFNANGNHTISLFDTTNGRPLEQFSGHNIKVGSMRYLPDQKLLLTAGVDGTIKFWKVDPAKWK